MMVTLPIGKDHLKSLMFLDRWHINWNCQKHGKSIIFSTHHCFNDTGKTRFTERTTNDRPLNLTMRDKKTYTVKTILKHQRRGRNYQYYVKWEGYLITKASWEPEESFLNNSYLLDRYKQHHNIWIHWPQKPLWQYLLLIKQKNSIGIFRIYSANSGTYMDSLKI